MRALVTDQECAVCDTSKGLPHEDHCVIGKEEQIKLRAAHSDHLDDETVITAMTADQIRNMTFSFNLIAKKVHRLNRKFYRDIETGAPIEKDPVHLIALMHSELSEMLEGIRKNTMDAHLPDRKTEEVELADLLIRAFDYAGFRGLDLVGAINEKIAYNTRRKDHSPEERRKINGKKF